MYICGHADVILIVDAWRSLTIQSTMITQSTPKLQPSIINEPNHQILPRCHAVTNKWLAWSKSAC